MKWVDRLALAAAIITLLLLYARLAVDVQPKAQPIRLIGMCNGQLLGAMEEDQFPAPCEWIEGVRFEEKGDDEAVRPAR